MSGQKEWGTKTRMIQLDQVKEAFHRWIHLEDAFVMDVVLGWVAANSLEGDAVNFYLIGPPSCGKTEILRSLNDHPKIYPLSSLTPQTLVSGFKDEKLNPQKSLLIKLQQMGVTMVVLKDFTTVLELRSEARQEILSQVREIADGYYRKTFGTGEEVSWSGKLAFLAGVTPVIDRHHSIHQVLGERFLYYRMIQGDPIAVAEMAQRFAGKESQMRNELKVVVKEFVDQFRDKKAEDLSIGVEINGRLTALACFVAVARTGVSRDRYTQALDYHPEPEGPSRLMKQFFSLSCGITIAQGKKEIDEGVYQIMKKVGRDCLPSSRNQILENMWGLGIRGGIWETTKKIGESLRYPVTTVKIQLEDLMVLGLIDQDNSGGGTTAPYAWKLSDRCCELIRSSEVY